MCVVASCVPPTGDLARNPGMCPDWESTQQPLASLARTQSIEPHQPGLIFGFKRQKILNRKNWNVLAHIIKKQRDTHSFRCGLIQQFK